LLLILFHNNIIIGIANAVSIEASGCSASKIDITIVIAAENHQSPIRNNFHRSIIIIGKTITATIIVVILVLALFLTLDFFI